jgi:hypothetical protein
VQNLVLFLGSLVPALCAVKGLWGSNFTTLELSSAIQHKPPGLGGLGYFVCLAYCWDVVWVMAMRNKAPQPINGFVI